MGCFVRGWLQILEEAEFTALQVGEAADTFGGAAGEEKGRAFEVFGYPFLARKRD